MHTPTKHLLAAAASLALCAPAAAQTAASPAASAASQAASPAETDDAAKASDASKPADAQRVEITGTRLKRFDPASPTIVIDAEDIRRGGYSSIEDVMRRLPQNLSSITSQGVAMELGGGAPDPGRMEYGRTSTLTSVLGASGVNLRGLGSRATLILVDGMRRPGSAQDAGGFTDISSIPISQIERIEIITDGASAIYGADAVAGVVNIILKKDYAGGTAQIRLEKSAAGADQQTLSAARTFSFSGGSITAAVNLQHELPGDAMRYIRVGPMGVGDFTALGGVNTRIQGLGAPGQVYAAMKMDGGFFLELGEDGRPKPPLGRVPTGQDGSNVTLDTLLPADPNLSSYIAPELGPNRIFQSLDLRGQLDLGDGHQMGATLNIGNQRNNRRYHPSISTLSVVAAGFPLSATLVPKKNPYNKFGEPIFVTYDYAAELSELLFTENQVQRNVNLSLTASGPFNLITGWRYQVAVGAGKEWGNTDSMRTLDSLGNPKDAKVVRDVANQLNVFSDGNNPDVVAANRVLLSRLYEPIAQPYASDAKQFDFGLSGEAFEMPAGKAELAVGFQARDERYEREIIELKLPLPAVRRSHAVYAEVGIPLLRDEADGTSLSLTLAARHERFDQRGASILNNRAYSGKKNLVELSGLDLPKMLGLNLIEYNSPQAYTALERTDSATSPLARLAWKLTPDLKLRGTWGRSFLTPTVTQLFGSSYVDDSTKAYTGAKGLPAGVKYLITSQGPNHDLKPQIATTRTAGFDWTPKEAPGLNLSATYSDVRFANYIGNVNDGVSFNDMVDNYTELLSSIAAMGDKGILFIDGRNINLAERRLRTLDLNASQFFSTSDWGDFTLSASMARTLQLSSQLAKWAPMTRQDNTEMGPPRWTGVFQVGWEYGAWTLGAAASHYSSFNVTKPLSLEQTNFNPSGENPNPQRRAASYTAVDVQASYAFDAPNDPWLSGLRLQAGVQNLFDRKPPFVDNAVGFLSSQFNARGRVLFIAVDKTF